MPLSKKAKKILLARLADGPRPTDEEVFPSRYGAPYVRLDTAGEDSGKGYFADAVQAARLKGKVTFHSLRHLWAVRLLTRGVPITIVSELLGHSHIQITVKRYGRFASDARVRWDAIRVLDQPEAETPPPPVQQPAAPKLVAIEGGRRGKRAAQ